MIFREYSIADVVYDPRKAGVVFLIA